LPSTWGEMPTPSRTMVTTGPGYDKERDNFLSIMFSRVER
jgi:hypothetical protein